MWVGFIDRFSTVHTENEPSPVGLCAIANALQYHPKHLLAIDSVQSRLKIAESLGAEPWNYQEQWSHLEHRLGLLTAGRGADIVIGRFASVLNSDVGSL